MASPTTFPRFPTLRRGEPRLYALSTLVGLVALACAFITAAAILAQRPPAWWRPIDPADPAVRRAANDLQNQVAEIASKIRRFAPGSAASETWQLSISADDANAWINTLMPRWLENQSDTFRWPSEIASVQVRFDDDRVLVGVEIQSAGSSQILCASVAPALRHGEIYAPARSISLGRLEVPKSWFLAEEPLAVAEDRIPKPLRDLPQTRDLAAAFSGRSPVRSALVALGDGRRVRILDVASRDGRITLTCRTEMRPPPAAAATSSPP
jgi:hypothetical protein